jgi:hypothetical protein
LNAVLELDQELITKLECSTCNTVEEIVRPLSEVTFEAGHCPTCGNLREASLSHVITGDEPFLHRTLASVGVPPLHIIRAHNGEEYRFYELSGDLDDALHFKHFDSSVKVNVKAASRIRIKDTLKIKKGKDKDKPLVIKSRSRVRLHD